MKQTRLSSAAIATVALTMAVGLATPAWASVNLDPFARNTRANALMPFRTAQAEMAEPEGEKGESGESKSARATPSGGSGTDSPPHQPPSAARTPVASTTAAASSPNAKTCSRDDECNPGTICEHGVCQAFDRPFDLLLYRRDGASSDLIPFYFSLRGNPGHRVIAPFYWHFWSPESRTRVVFPFYWRVEDHLKQRVVTVVGLYSSTRQPDARSWAVWPFFYASTKFGWAAPLLGSFTIGDPDRQKALGLLGFLYFWTRNGDDKFDVSPLFVSTRSKQSAFTFALPLNFYWRNSEGSNLLILPFGLRHRNKDGGYFGSLLGYSTVEGESKTGAFFWLYWFGRSPTDNYDVGFPLLWSFRSPESSTTVVPPVFHARRGDSYIGSAALLAWWGGKRDKGSNWQLLLPFYYGGRGDHGKTALYLSPLGGYRRDDNAGSHGLTWLAPPVLRWHDKQSELESYLLFYWHYRDIPGASDTTLVGNYYQRTDPNGSTRVFFPLFWQFKDKTNGASAHSLLPFYFHRHSAEERTTTAGIFPLWAYWRRFADGGHSAGLFPFVFSGERHDRSHLIVAPLLWHFRSQDKSTTLALPFWYHSRDASSSHTTVPLLLYFSGQDCGSSYHVQIPLFWHFADSRRGTSTTIAPLFFRDVDRQGTANGILPLVFWGSGQRSHFVLFPVIWHFSDDSAQRSTTVVGPYWHRRWGDESTDALFPIFHYRRGTRPGGQEESSLTLFPLFHYRKSDQSSLFLSPLAAWTHRPGLKAGFAGLYFWIRNDQVDAQGVPLLYLDHTRLSTGERTRMFGPWIMVDSPTVSTRVLFPLYARYRENGEVGTYVFPLYFGRRSDSGYHLDSFLPFYWSSYDQHHRALSIGPWWKTRDDQAQSRSTGLLPLYVSATNPKRSFLATPLFYYHRDHATQTSQVIAPLYFQSSRPDGGWRVVFPLWWQSRDKGESQAILFPLYWHFANRDEQRAFTLAGLFFWSHKGTDRTRGLLPLGWYSRDPQNETGSNALMPLFYESHTRTSQTVATALFGFGTGPDRFWMYVPPFLWKDNSQSRFSMLFPLWFSSTNKATETSTRVIPPLLHYAHSTPTHSLSTALLLFWRKTDVLSSTTLGLPLYYDIHNYRDSRLTMFLPLYMRYRNHVSEQTYNMVFPLFYSRSGPTDSTTIGFPLYWRFWSPERSTTILFPLYWGVRRPTWEGAYIFPSIWTSKGLGPEAGTSHFWFIPFWEHQVKRPGDVMWEALLGMFGYERIGRNRFLKILFIPFELEPVSPTKTAWYGRAPKRPSARGLNTQIW